jgi:hypothetical protein
MNSFDAGEALKMRGIKVVAVTGGVAAVADNTWRAFQAAEAIEFDWGPAASRPSHGGSLAGARRQLHRRRPRQPQAR